MLNKALKLYNTRSNDANIMSPRYRQNENCTRSAMRLGCNPACILSQIVFVTGQRGEKNVSLRREPSEAGRV